MIKCKPKHQTQSSLFKQNTSRPWPTACLAQQPVGPERCRVYHESRVCECWVIVWDDHLGKTSAINIEHQSARGEWWYNSCASFHIVKDSCGTSVAWIENIWMLKLIGEGACHSQSQINKASPQSKHTCWTFQGPQKPAKGFVCSFIRCYSTKWLNTFIPAHTSRS